MIRSLRSLPGCFSEGSLRVPEALRQPRTGTGTGYFFGCRIKSCKSTLQDGDRHRLEPVPSIPFAPGRMGTGYFPGCGIKSCKSTLQPRSGDRHVPVPGPKNQDSGFLEFFGFARSGTGTARSLSPQYLLLRVRSMKQLSMKALQASIEKCRAIAIIARRDGNLEASAAASADALTLTTTSALCTRAIKRSVCEEA